MIKKILCLFVVLSLVLVFSFSSFGVGSASSDSQMGLNNFIEMENYYLYIPEDYVKYIRFNNDGILYFQHMSTINCLLVYKTNNSNMYQCAFPSIFMQNSTNYTYKTIEDYYSQRVTVTSYSTNFQHLSPIKYDDIINTDLSFNHSVSDLFDGLILVFIVLGDILSVFMIFSNRNKVIVK